MKCELAYDAKKIGSFYQKLLSALIRPLIARESNRALQHNMALTQYLLRSKSVHN